MSAGSANKSKKTAETKQVPQKKKKVESSSDSDSSSDESVKVVAKKASKKVVKKAESSSDSDSSSDAKPVKKTSRKASAAKASSSDSDSDSSDAKPAKKVSRKASAAKESSSDSDAEEKPAKAEEKSADAEAVSDEHDGKLELFVQGLSFDTTEESLREFFGSFGNLSKCKLLSAGGVSKGKAFVEFEDHKVARKALAGTNQQDLDGRTIWVEFSGQAAGGYKPQGDGEVNTIFVGNLGFRTEQWSIEEFFKGCGTITSVRIAQDENGRSRGFAHVEFGTNGEAVKGMELAGQSLDGREVRLDLSQSRRGGGGGGRGGGRGGFGGDRGGRGGGFGGGRGGGFGGGRGGGFGGGRGGDRGGRGGFGGGRGGDRGGRGGSRGGFQKFEGTRTML